MNNNFWYSKISILSLRISISLYSVAKMKLHRLFRNFFEIHEVFLYSKQPKPIRKLKSLEKLNHTRFEPSVGNFEFYYICSINDPSREAFSFFWQSLFASNNHFNYCYSNSHFNYAKRKKIERYELECFFFISLLLFTIRDKVGEKSEILCHIPTHGEERKEQKYINSFINYYISRVSVCVCYPRFKFRIYVFFHTFFFINCKINLRKRNESYKGEMKLRNTSVSLCILRSYSYLK